MEREDLEVGKGCEWEDIEVGEVFAVHSCWIVMCKKSKSSAIFLDCDWELGNDRVWDRYLGATMSMQSNSVDYSFMLEDTLDKLYKLPKSVQALWKCD